MTQAAYTSEIVETRLYEAGRSLVALRVSGLRPATYRSGMPDFQREVVESYNVASADYRVSPPTAREIDAMDQALTWIQLLPGSNTDEMRVRKLVGARILCSPKTDRPFYSWRQLGKEIGASHTTAKTLFLDAVSTITRALNRPGLCQQLAAARRDADRSLGRCVNRARTSNRHSLDLA